MSRRYADPNRPVCAFPGCDRQFSCRGWCDLHYTRWKKHGDPAAYWPNKGVPRKRSAPIERFEASYKVASSGCWLWVRRIRPNGYSNFSDYDERGRLKSVYAHRWSYEHFVGPIPDGLHIDHLCRVRHCVNPAHLEAVTQAENNRRTARDECPRSHPRTPENTYVSPDGRRQCRVCIQLRRQKDWRDAC